ncbi:hypothetical protein J2S13_002840 [Oikeobacillus pervagus]|uniref:Uncharacterized protein n=1 Tax=Oikeobacillus pervagus TaxID=1325931 RepID=A0AAJ1T436_9BACI|nr:hypothetical protein [Oikeobacillus pervagus]
MGNVQIFREVVQITREVVQIRLGNSQK